jgi:ACS family hexuronate transporter-like MFS transporter
MRRSALRWLPVGLIVTSTMLNYLDRALLSAAAPTLKAEFHLNNAQYGQLGSAFSIVYALMAPLAGLFLDAIGLTLGASIAVGFWSLAAAATAATRTLPPLVAVRMLLGISEAAGIPSTGKTFATYLPPEEMAIGTASNSIGVSAGAILAPLLLAAIAPVWGWRAAFVVGGGLGLLWVPVWLWIVRVAPASPVESRPRLSVGDLFEDRHLWGISLTNAFIMMLYTLWFNWTTIYFVSQRHLSEVDANRLFAWIPPVFGCVGGLAGGWIMLHWIRGGLDPVRARIRLAGITSVLLLGTAAVPLMPTVALAAAAISLSFFFTMALSVAVYALPLDLFGPARAGFSIAALTCALGLMQVVLLPLIGVMVDRGGFNAVCIGLAFTPLIGYGILRYSLRF